MQPSNRYAPSTRRAKPLSAIAFTIMMLAPLAAIPTDAYVSLHWSSQTRLNPTQAADMSSLAVKVAEDGSAMAVWVQATAGGADIYARRYTPAGGWAAEAAVDTSANSAFLCTMRVVGNHEGDVAVSWLEWNGTYSVMGAVYTAGWGWSPSHTVSFNSTVYGNCDMYAVAINENGDASFFWETTNGTVWHARAARFTQGSGWTGEEIVAQMGNGTAYDQNVAIDDAGTTTVIWGENNGSDEWLYASRSSAVGVWSSPSLVFKGFDNGPSLVIWTNDLRVVAPLPGLVVASWQVQNQSTQVIWEVRYQNGAWTTAAIISDNGLFADYPALAYSANGTTTLSFVENSRVSVKWFTPGIGWSANSNVTGFVNYIENAVAVSAAGRTVVAWQQYNGTGWHVFASTWAPWTTWSTPKQVDFAAPNASTSWVSAGVDASGDGIVAWPSYNGTFNQPWASRLFNADPDPLPLTMDYPRNRESVGVPSITVRGHTAAGATVQVNGVSASVLPDGSYSATITLTHGWTRVVVNATGSTGPVAAVAAWVAYTDPSYARANETADAALTGWTPVRNAGGAAEMTTLYTSYGGSIMLTFAVSYGANGDGMMYWIASNGSLPYTWYATPYVNGTGWLAPHLLSANSNAPFNPSVMTDSAGRSMVVWEQNLGLGNTIYAARFDRFLGWADNEDLTPAPDVGYFPRAAMGSNGDVFVTYARANVSGTQYAAKRYSPGSGWQPSVVLGQANLIADQAVAVGGALGAAAAWVNRTNGYSNITVYRFNSGNGSWGPGVLALVNSTYIYNMRAVVNGSGAMTIVYRQPTVSTTFYNLTAVSSDASNNWGAPVDIDGPLNASTIDWHYSASVDAHGDVMVIFLQVVSGVQRPVAVRYTPEAGWGTTTFLDNDPSISKGWVTGDVSDDGSAIGAWYEANGSARVQAVRYIPGQGWQAPVFLTPVGGNNIDAVVAMTTGGRALVVSLHYPNYGCCYSTIGAWRFTPPDLAPPALTILAPSNNSTTGAGWAAVRGTTEPGARVWVNGFQAVVAANGTWTVSVPLVNGSNLLSALAMDAANNTALAWTNVTFVDPVLVQLGNLSATDAAIQLNLAGVNASLSQAITNLGVTTAQELANLNASLLASLAAQNASLAAQIGAVDADLLVRLAALNSTLLAALTAQNSSLWNAINAAASANAAANQAVSDALNDTADALRIEIAALRSSQNMTNANVTAAVLRIAALEARLLALASDLNLTHDELLALIDDIQADLNDTRSEFNAQLDAAIGDMDGQIAAGNTNATNERLRVNAAFDTLDARLNSTRFAISQSDANLTAAVSDLKTTDQANHAEGAHATEVAQGAQGIGTIGMALAAVGIAVALLAAVLAMRARRPVVDDSPPPHSTQAPAPAEEVKVDTVSHEAHNGHSMTAASEAAAGESPDEK